MTDVEIVIPVYNEAKTLSKSIERVLSSSLRAAPFTWQLTIADNGSRDKTLGIARDWVLRVPDYRVQALHHDEKGRGRAIKHAWLSSRADVVAYMDVDLSADLDALPALVGPLLSGHADVAIGTRWSPKADVQRSLKRLAVSWVYNHLLQLSLGVHFTDAMCGFKAMQTPVARKLLPQVVDNEWFFDAELLVLAERAGYRIHEVPLTWRDDPNSSVDIPRTAAKALAGMWRMRNTRAVPSLTAV